jgi:hypothetical protein
VSNKVAANMLARAARFIFDRNCDPKRAPPIETSRMLNAQFHLRLRGSQKIEPQWEKVPKVKTHKFFITEGLHDWSLYDRFWH